MDRTRQLGRLATLSLALAGAGWLASCVNTPSSSKPGATPAVAGAASGAASSAAPTPAVAPAPAPASEPAASTPAALQQAQRLATSAVELLEVGNEEQALAEIQRALQADPANRLALLLQKQIQTDPQTLLGREFFNYRVEPGESLSRIAGRFLKDVHLFYALARYNDIKIPRQLQGGQLIKVPGKAPAPPPPAPTPAPAPPAPPTPKPPPAPPPADERAVERERKAKIATATRAARSAFARQDLKGAIRHWDTVLELDPDNSTAQLERKKAIELLNKLSNVK